MITLEYDKSVDPYYLSDCEKISDIMKEQGYQVSLYDCYLVWDEISDDCCANWLILDAYTEEDIVSMVRSKLTLKWCS